ncbi:MAG: hypothetical protein GC168_12670 [Candidatus Hydrogenedens sp.]|nr:hypothetical protein [Candidatus Hydrogenedens sp.]
MPLFGIKGRKILATALAVLGCVLGAGSAHAIDVDFDAHILEVDAYLDSTGSTVNIKGSDNDANGLREEDQLGMLSAILSGGDAVACINATTRNTISSAYTYNVNNVAAELVVTISGVGTVNIIDQVASTSPALGTALQELLAGFLVIADNSTITFINSLADQLVANALKGTPQESQTTTVQNQITFLATAFRTHGNAPTETDFLGPNGNIDNDAETNLEEYTDGAVPKTREEWLLDNCITPTLRISKFEGGGLRISGLSETFVAEAAGAAGPVTYQWRKGTETSSSVVGGSSTFTIPFLTSSSTGTYFCILSDGVTTRTTPLASLSVTTVPIFFAQQPQGGTRFPGGSFTFTAAVQGGVGSGPYSYQWQKDGANVGTNSPTLSLTNLTQNDAGNYRVRVTSNGGGDLITSSTARLTIRQLNFNLNQQPVSAKKYVGDTHAFTVSVSGGSGNFSYVWQKNGSSLGAPNSATLNLGVIDAMDAGSYTCVITDLSSPSNAVTTDAATLEVKEPVVITEQPVGGQKQTGALLELSIEAEGGYGPLRFQWLWEGVPILNQTSPSYSAVALAGFDGTFQCRVTDDNGLVVLSDGAEITLVPAIVITQQPVGARVYTGTSRTLTTAASGGQPPLSYQWYKDGNSLGVSGIGPSLAFASLQVADSGNYFCRVTDDLDSVRDSEPVLVQVADMPMITVQPVGANLIEGDPLQLSTAATGGMPPVTYKWTRNGFSLLNGAQPNFSINSVVASDAGTYLCTIEDNLGTKLTTNAAIVQVSSPLRFLQQPVSATRGIGQDVSFSVDATGGVGFYSFDWRKDGVSLGAPSNPTLSISGVIEADGGDYTCRVTDSANTTITSQVATLTVVPALSAVAQPVGGEFYVSQPLSLTFGVAGGLGPYSYQWYKGESPIPNANEETFNIASLQLADTGLYGCIVTDQLSMQLISDIVAVSVTPQIVITGNPAGGDKYTGASQTFRVTASGGTGIYEYSWRKNGEAIPGAPDAATYVIPSLLPDDSGFYDCVVRESQGGIAASFTTLLRVRDLVTPVSQPQDSIGVAGSTVTLSFTVQGGFEPVRYQWNKDGVPITGAIGATLTLEPLADEDEGDYTCVAYDVVTSVIESQPATVIVAQPLTIQQQPQGDTRGTGASYTFSVVVTGGIGNLEYTWFKDAAALPGLGTAELALTGLDNSDTGIYFCVIEDQSGARVFSDEALLQVSDAPITVAVQPTSATRYVGESATFTVTASGGVGDLLYQWRRNQGQGFENIEGATGATLVLDDLALADAGSYRCVVSDEAGHSVPSFSALLTVVPRLTIVKQPLSAAAYTGSNVTFSVGFTGGIGTISYQWFRNNNFVGTNSSQLVLTDIDEGDAGTYKCLISAERDSVLTEEVELKTGAPLTILSTGQTVTRYAGESLDFTVETTGGVGFMQYQWYLDGEPINITKNFRIDALTEADSGQYTVAVADEVSVIGGDVLYDLDVLAVEGELDGPIHSADLDGNNQIDLIEMLRVIQLFNARRYHCDDTQEDGFAPGTNFDAPRDCPFHSSDFDPRDRVISLGELLRTVQIFRVGAYRFCPSDETEDAYCVDDLAFEGEGGA